MSGLTWVLGDVHGCADELRSLLDRLELDSEDRLRAAGGTVRNVNPHAFAM